MRAIKSYVRNAAPRRATFSGSLTAWDADSAGEHVTRWARKARLASDASFRITRPDGSQIDIGDAVRPYLEAG